MPVTTNVLVALPMRIERSVAISAPLAVSRTPNART
jgi:hypothetical protein